MENLQREVILDAFFMKGRMADIGIITCNMGRPRILQIFCTGIKRLRKETRLEIPVVCTGDIEGKSICEDYGITHIEYPNKPLTGKFNRACLEMKGKVDYVCIFGSDNVMSTKSFLRIQEEADKGIDLIGLSEVYFFGMDQIYTGNLYHFQHTTVLGVGRTVSARVLDNLGWQPWLRERDRSIDTLMLDSVRPYVKTRALLDGEFVVDLKTSMNLNKIDFWSKKLKPMADQSILWDNIGEEEMRLIKSYLEEQR